MPVIALIEDPETKWLNIPKKGYESWLYRPLDSDTPKIRT